MNQKYQVAIIGYGWAATAHIAAINATSNAEVCAVWSSRPLDSAELSAKHGSKITAYTDLQQMLASPDVQIVDIVDSADHWTFPGVWSCVSCSQSIAEVVYGIHDVAGTAKWMVISVRCVECGDVAGVTDIVLGEMPVDDLLASL